MPETSSMKDLDSGGGVRLGAEVCRDNTWIANHRFRFAIGHDLPSIHHYEMMAKSPDHAHQVLNHQKCYAISGKVLNGPLPRPRARLPRARPSVHRATLDVGGA